MPYNEKEEAVWKNQTDNDISNLNNRMVAMEKTGKEILDKISSFERKAVYVAGAVSLLCAIPTIVLTIIKIYDLVQVIKP